MNISGYLEVNGEITKITSMDSLKAFMQNLGESVNEPTEEDYAFMCSDKYEDEKSYTDDCGVDYSNKNRLLWGNLSLTTYNVMDGTKFVSTNAFATRGSISSSLHSLLISDSVVAIGTNSFSNSCYLRSIILSKNLMYIGPHAYSRCFNLLNFDFPESIKYIGAYSFYCCHDLTEMVFPASLRKIGSFAFSNCKKLGTVTFKGILPYAGSGIFDECVNLKEIHIPKGSLEHYIKIMPFYKDKFVEE